MKANQTDKVKKRTVMTKRSKCPLCGCKDLLSDGPDQFCLTCEWDTCAEYVARGLMDNIELSCFVHFPPQAPATSACEDGQNSTACGCSETFKQPA